jgi:hypothetical protein
LKDDVVIPPAPQEGKKPDEIISKDSQTNLQKKEDFVENRSFEISRKRETRTFSSEDHKVIRATCLVGLLVWFVLIIFLSMATKSPPFNIFLGLSPVMLTIIVAYILVDKFHLESGFLLVFPFIFTALFFILGYADLLGEIDYLTLSVVNIIFGLVFMLVIIIHYAMINHSNNVDEEIIEESTFKTESIVPDLSDEEGIKSFVASIEDKSKAINHAIGRVYSVKKGGSDVLRSKIRIDPEHYNEFNELKNHNPEHRKNLAIGLVRNIRHSLNVLELPEKKVFRPEEIEKLERLERKPDGSDRVLDVLINNDKDPVKSYFEGAVEFCDKALKELEELKE